jgi:low affinity Fe/Cu permease
MAEQEVFHLMVQVNLEDSDAEELDEMTRRLADEIGEQEVVSVELARSGAAPLGTKAADAITLGAVVVAVLPSVLPKLVDFCQAWALRGQGRTVKFKGKVGGQEIEFEGKAEDLKIILAQLSSAAPGQSQV